MKLKYITRIDSRNTHGWWVRVTRCKIKKQKFFADLSYESKDWALLQAMIWLDKTLDKLELVGLERKFTLKSKSNKYGWVARVQRKFSKEYNDKLGNYEVRWGYHDDTKTKHFSIKQLGKDVAERKAHSFAKKLNEERFNQIKDDLVRKNVLQEYLKAN